VPADDAVTIKQVLDLGAQNILVPMISNEDQARAVVEMTQYPPAGRRGVGSALARSSRWNRVGGYLSEAAAHVSVLVQVETVDGVKTPAKSLAHQASMGSWSAPAISRRRWAYSGSKPTPRWSRP
jgi:4-hydroxy-2-oxoheptanedioate aldolase